jgi:hypothetical protein
MRIAGLNRLTMLGKKYVALWLVRISEWDGLRLNTFRVFGFWRWHFNLHSADSAKFRINGLSGITSITWGIKWDFTAAWSPTHTGEGNSSTEQQYRQLLPQIAFVNHAVSFSPNYEKYLC